MYSNFKSFWEVEKINNIIFEKNWEDEAFIEIKITAISKFSTSYQMCYVDESDITQMSDKIETFISDHSQDVSIDLGEKQGNYTPAFSMTMKKADIRGHVQIEVDIEIDDTDDRCHRCKYFVESELGAVERFGKKLVAFYKTEVGSILSMF